MDDAATRLARHKRKLAELELIPEEKRDYKAKGSIIYRTACIKWLETPGKAMEAGHGRNNDKS